MISFIIFSMVETRVMVIFAISVGSYFARNLGYQYTKVVKTIFHYLKNSRDEKIIYDSLKKL